MYAEQLLPHDIEAEESIIGALLIDSDSFLRISHLIKPEDFYRERNRLCFTACTELFQRSEGIDQITLARELDRAGQLENVGGMAYLSQLIASTPTSAHAEFYAQLISRTSTMRRLINAASRISAIGYEDTDDVETTLRQAEDVLFQVRANQPERGFISLRQIYDQYLEERAAIADPMEASAPVMTGFSDLDELLGGMQRSDMIILGARPSLGKSALVVNVSLNAAKNGATVGIFSLEMSREQLALRILAGEAEVDAHRLRLGLYTEAEEQRIIDAIGNLSDLPVYIDDTPFQGLVEMRSKARRLSLSPDGLDLLVVDYLQLIQGQSRYRGGEKPGAGNKRNIPLPQRHRPGLAAAGSHLFPVEPAGGRTPRSPAAALRPARQRQHRAGRRYCYVHLPGGRLLYGRGVGPAVPQSSVSSQHRRNNRSQAPSRANRQRKIALSQYLGAL